MSTNLVTRSTFMDAVVERGVAEKVIHTVKRSVMEHFDKKGELIGSAEYIKNSGAPCTVNYRLSNPKPKAM